MKLSETGAGLVVGEMVIERQRVGFQHNDAWASVAQRTSEKATNLY